MRILFAEDQEPICQRMKDALATIGFNVCEYKCVESLHDLGNALVYFEPSVILLDLTLKNTNAQQAIEQIPLLNQYAPVIVVTGSAHYYVDCMKKGAYNFLYKPVALAPGVEAHLAKDIKTARDKWLFDHGKSDLIAA